MTNESLRRVEFSLQIPYHLQPFRPDYSQTPSEATFFSNGYKSIRSRQLGIRTESYKELSDAMEQAENACHRAHKPSSSLGPMNVDGVPYPIITAMAKGEIARKILWEDGRIEGIGIVSDVVIAFVKNGRSFEITAHKLKSEKDRELLISELYQSDLAGDVEVKTFAALYRFDMQDLHKPAEIYLSELSQGYDVEIDNMNVLLRQLSVNSPTSGSLNTMFMLKHLTKHGDRLKGIVSRFDEEQIKQYQETKRQNRPLMGYLIVPNSDSILLSDRNVGPKYQVREVRGTQYTQGGVKDNLQPLDQAYFDIPSDNHRFAEDVALGFIN